MCSVEAAPAGGSPELEEERPMAYPFLSDAWFDAVEALRDKAPSAPEEVADIAVNMVVTGGPDGDRTLHFAEGRFDRGLVEGAPTTVTVPHRVARSMLVDLDPEAAITAFMNGRDPGRGRHHPADGAAASAGAMLTPTPEQLAFVGRAPGAHPMIGDLLNGADPSMTTPPPALPELGDLVERSEWLRGRPGLEAEVLRWHRSLGAEPRAHRRRGRGTGHAPAAPHPVRRAVPRRASASCGSASPADRPVAAGGDRRPPTRPSPPPSGGPSTWCRPAARPT